MNVGNCSRCRKLYQVNSRKLCPECVKEEEAQFDAVRQFLREHDPVDAQGLSEALSIPVERVIQFLKEGRLIETVSIEYPCESCGTLIRTGRLCEPCRQSRETATREIANQLRRELGAEGNRHNAASAPGYYSSRKRM